jgi:hypothetical protein
VREGDVEDRGGHDRRGDRRRRADAGSRSGGPLSRKENKAVPSTCVRRRRDALAGGRQADQRGRREQPALQAMARPLPRDVEGVRRSRRPRVRG